MITRITNTQIPKELLMSWKDPVKSSLSSRISNCWDTFKKTVTSIFSKAPAKTQAPLKFSVLKQRSKTDSKAMHICRIIFGASYEKLRGL